MTTPRVLIIGLDGATLDLAGPWMDAGDLPNLAQLRATGGAGPLTSTLHPITGAAWPSFLTGMNQGQHGIYDFIRRIPQSYNFELTDGSDLAAPTLFQIASRHGKRVISLNVPVTFPPRAVNGVMVSGLFAQPAPNIAYPAGVYEELVKLVGDYPILPRYDPYTRDPLGDYLQQLHQMTDKHLAAMLHLMQPQAWDLAMVVFTATDLVQHAFWKDMTAGDTRFKDAIREIYQHVDQAIGRLRAAAGDNCLTLVMSDHGAGPLESFVQLNRWLADAGFLRFLPTYTSWRARLVKTLWSTWRRVLPPAWIGYIRTRVGARYNQMRDQMESALFATRIDWPQTRAYALGACGNVFINLAGREPQGVVQPGVDYEATCAAITRQLLDLVDPLTGQKLVAEVRRREQVYHGPFLEQAADLIVLWRDYKYWGRGRYDFDGPEVFHRQRKWDFSELPLNGTHRMNGLFLFAGTAARALGSLEGARIIDVAPTVLAALGVPIPQAMDGQVLLPIFAEPPQVQVEAAAAGPADGGTRTYSEAEAAEIEERLKSLGYL